MIHIIVSLFTIMRNIIYKSLLYIVIVKELLYSEKMDIFASYLWTSWILDMQLILEITWLCVYGKYHWAIVVYFIHENLTMIHSNYFVLQLFSISRFMACEIAWFVFYDMFESDPRKWGKVTFLIIYISLLFAVIV